MDRYIGRYAPTPSGRMHLGNLSTLLLAWLDARSGGGRFLLRIEDLDRARCKPAYTDQLLRDLDIFGFDYDGTPVRQSERDICYIETLEKLKKAAWLYECFCTRAELHSDRRNPVDADANAPQLGAEAPVYSGKCRNLSDADRQVLRLTRNPSLRIEVPDCDISFRDLKFGDFTENLARNCGDFVLRRSDGGWAYQLAVVADDAAQGITTVVRGRDLLSSTPRQIWLFSLLGKQPPSYLHVPLLMAPDGRRLSKRERDKELGAMLEHLSPGEIIGRLAFLLGIAPDPSPRMPGDLLPCYRRERIPTDDIVVPADFLD